MSESLREQIKELEDEPLDVRSGVSFLPPKKRRDPKSNKSGSVDPT
jgi:hypothetical protein